LNARDVIVRTIESVLHQSYENIEYIIVDGGSTDGTADALRKYDDFIDYWISEPDSGLYAASNKAISLMLGDAHQFLNAGDYLDGDVFSKEPIIPSLAIVYFNGVQGGVRKARLRNSKHGMPYCREGILFESKGILYNEKYRVAADYQYYLDHGYERPPPKGNGSGSVVVSFGFSRKLYWQGYMESSRIVLRAFGPLHFSWCCLTGIVKGLVKSILRSTM